MNFGVYRNNSLINACIDERYIPGAIRLALKSMFRHWRVDVEIDGIKFRVCPAQNHHDMIIARGRLLETERDAFQFLERYLSHDDVLVDIGANIGAISIPVAMKTKARVIAIEPTPVNAERLRCNVSLNALSNFTVIACAAGPAGIAQLWQYTGNSGRNSVLKPKKAHRAFEVLSKPLLQILTEAGASSVKALKIDVEGFEDRVLLPFFENAPRSLWPMAVLIEHKHHRAWKYDCIKALTNIGYRIEAKDGANTMLILDR